MRFVTLVAVSVVLILAGCSGSDDVRGEATTAEPVPPATAESAETVPTAEPTATAAPTPTPTAAPTPTPTAAPTPTVVPAEGAATITCDGLAQRWAVLQQEYLDRLGEASQAELDEPSRAVLEAHAFIGRASIEQARDQDLAGCTDLVPGSAEYCAFIPSLGPSGEAGAIVLERLQSECDDT
ncbi:MAG: hypothetical protein AAF567_18615 [Actinomycetota bacterium]